MAAQTSSPPWLLLIGFTVSMLIFSCHAASSDNRQATELSLFRITLHLCVYIVYMGDLPKGKVSIPSLHTAMIREVVPRKIIGAKFYKADGDFEPDYDIQSPRDSEAAPNTSHGYTSEDSRYCDPGTLDKTLVEGKILFCDYYSQADGPIDAGAVAAVFQTDRRKDYVFPYGLPLSNLNLDDGRNVLNYANTAENPTATIFKTQVDGNQFAPFVVSFSSRGPSSITADILKPDLTAPGVDILAAWSGIPPLTDTDAFPMNSENNLEAEFAYGAGHINPALAARPGLIYDAGEVDFVNFLCGQGYSSKQLALITGSNSTCSEETSGTVWDLNYPSFALSTTPGNSVTRVFHRTVTNVGSAVSTYKAVVNAPPGLVIQVQPSVLSFKSLGQKQSFTVTVGAEVGNSMISGALIWDDGVHQVRSPIVAYASLLE
ncbi:hypothetical protein V6N11_053826 [Hibiscus sabdariffa]|uniref:Subtilisin-like protease fibronectin type-III domain-containing protein n=1 Tax=Hibiscus sabdariffa TaxID=183260 RepID=A0ABR2S226_9ROSI